jgi:hypothetical protein
MILGLMCIYAPLPFSTEVRFRISLKFFSWTSERERFDKLILTQKPVRLARNPTGTNVLNGRTFED